jgi:hypothetical protein
MVSGRAREKGIKLSARLPWMVFAPFEFIVTVLMGVLLYLVGALYFAACVFLAALSGLFKRACALAVQRFRTGRVFARKNGAMGAPLLSEIVARRAESGQRRPTSWLN